MARIQRRLIDPSYKQYDKVSRYSSVPYYFDTETKKYIYGTSVYLDEGTTYTLHEVEKFDTWDSLASYYYNNPTLYWVICSFNRVFDPFTNPEIGSFIKIPNISEIRFLQMK